MTERPILFSAPMVRAILEGRKTQTRRILKPQPIYNGFGKPGEDTGWEIPCHCGSYPPSALLWPDENGGMLNGDAGHPWVGVERLWVKETFAWHCNDKGEGIVTYRSGGARFMLCEDNGEGDPVAIGAATEPNSRFVPAKWKPSIQLPRWASRITLEIADVHAERLNDISEADAIAEGVSLSGSSRHGYEARFAYQLLWEDINGFGSWANNPWVWVIKFKPTEESR